MRLISTIAAMLFVTSTLAAAAPRQGAVGQAKGAHRHAIKSKSVKTAKRTAAKASYRKTTRVRKTTAAAKPGRIPTTAEAKSATVVERPHDPKAEEREIKRLKKNVKAAEKAGDWRRAAHERRVMYQLEADVRADKADDKDRLRAARNAKKKSRIPFWGWWR